MLTTELVAAALVLTAVDGCQDGRPFVRLSLEWQARSIPVALGEIARGEVEAIWQRLGVTVQWTSRDASRWPAPAVHVAITDELTRTRSGARLPKLGWIEFWGNRPGNLLQVSAAAALAAVWEGRTVDRLSSGQPLAALWLTAARLIGRAIAHELGHYLLRSRQHTAWGLMRPVFPAHEGTIPLLDRYRLDRRLTAVLKGRSDERGGPGCGNRPAQEVGRVPARP